MDIAIIGLGGVGGYIAANIAKNTNHNVVGFARGEHLKAIQKDGIKIVEDKESWSVNLDARELKDAKGVFDIVLFCVKSYDIKSSYEAIKGHITADTTLLSISNGVENVLKNLSDARVLEGCAYILSHIQEAGVIRKKGEVFAVVFGGDDKEGVESLAKVFDEASLRYKTPQNIKEAIWKKYIFISTFATLTSYYNKPIGYIYEHHKDEAKTLLKEIADAAAKEGLDISDEIEKALVTASKVPYESSTSMHLDFQNKKQTELDFLSGYVKAPLMEKLYNELKKR
ncbi:MAG: 2-dehydropantoate 2-reductase [Campylobacterales bacterium]|nr:2-dehydropantoate 2-reductase [Campylobacterales bacterium]